MGISLLDIKDELESYAKTISKLFSMNVGICDEKLVRISGTGPQKIGEKIKGKASKKSLKSKETIVILNPREDKICEGCSEKSLCKEVLEISSPIINENKIIGLITLVLFDKKQKSVILENLDDYLEFIKQMANLISIRFTEYREGLEREENELVLSTILNFIDRGVIRYDENFIVTGLNSFTRKLIEVEKIIGKKINLIEKNESILEKKIFKMEIEDKQLDVIGKIFTIGFLNRKEKIFIFDDMNKINDKLRGIYQGENCVSLDNILGESLAINRIKDEIKRVANFKSTVLITGESGTGKELIARALHYHSSRRNAPFVVINCAAIPEALLETELFGYVKGAFTGADKNGRIGKFELANGGVIFLDEIGDMPHYLQAKLLRVLQERKITRLGSNQEISLDIRIIAATNVDLEKKILEREFREDLYYRLKVIPFEIPPLRERKEDIIPIVDELIRKYSKIIGKDIVRLEDRVMREFLNYDWPGNIRELENVVEFMVNLSDGVLLTSDSLPEKILRYKKCKGKIESLLSEELEEFEVLEEQYIKKGLEIYGDSTEGKRKIANKMNIGLTTLYRKIQKYGI